ncbi:hypothetical protein E2C01_073458 [Portunus trituberculatus]|uniref:Uncharacterized protein n=1 Tax=Portunus trituberculatus TaxID=210409 RepID=A0A5B7IAL1_PORTR|nr:hypothetical protein [Portunus trituberculatus]
MSPEGGELSCHQPKTSPELTQHKRFFLIKSIPSSISFSSIDGDGYIKSDET